MDTSNNKHFELMKSLLKSLILQISRQQFFLHNYLITDSIHVFDYSKKFFYNI